MTMMIAAAGNYTDDYYEADGYGEPMVLERRSGSRVKIARPIKLVELSTGRHIAGRSRDVSATGMRLEIHATNNLREGDTVQVDVGMLSGIGPLIHRPRVIPARVVWMHGEQKLLRPLLTVGVEFEVDLDAIINVA